MQRWWVKMLLDEERVQWTNIDWVDLTVAAQVDYWWSMHNLLRKIILLRDRHKERTGMYTNADIGNGGCRTYDTTEIDVTSQWRLQCWRRQRYNQLLGPCSLSSRPRHHSGIEHNVSKSILEADRTASTTSTGEESKNQRQWPRGIPIVVAMQLRQLRWTQDTWNGSDETRFESALRKKAQANYGDLKWRFTYNLSAMERAEIRFPQQLVSLVVGTLAFDTGMSTTTFHN